MYPLHDQRPQPHRRPRCSTPTRASPRIEKRFEQVKTVHEIAPVFLKNEGRIEALFTLYFLGAAGPGAHRARAAPGHARGSIEELPLYPEQRQCGAPTTEQVLRLFSLAERHTLLCATAGRPRRSTPELTDLQRQVLACSAYHSAPSGPSITDAAEIRVKLPLRCAECRSSAELARLTETLARRIGRFLERQGWLTRDAENSDLAGDELEAGSMEQLLGSSNTYRIAMGRNRAARCSRCRRCRRVTSHSMTGSAIWPMSPACRRGGARMSARSSNGVPLTSAGRLSPRSACRHPKWQCPLRAEDAVSRRHDARPLRTAGFHRPAGGFGTQAACQPDPLARLVCTEQQTPRAGDTGQGGRGDQRAATGDREEPTPAERRAAMSLKRSASKGSSVSTSRPARAAAVRIIACIEDPLVIPKHFVGQALEKILAHVDAKAVEPETPRLPPCRAPPQVNLFD